MKKIFLINLFLFISSFNLLGQDKPAGKISGYMFGDYFYNVSRDPAISSLNNTALNGEKDFQGFAFRRIYFTYDYNISDRFSTRFRVEADQKSNTSDGKFGVTVKDAYLKYQEIFDGSDLIVGLQPSPTFEISEKYWGYRSLEKTIMDLRKIASSRDLGISLKGKLTSNGIVNYWITIANGEGNKPEVNKYKRFYAHLDFQPDKNIRITVYGDLNVQSAIDDPNSSTTPKATVSNNILTTAVFVGYQQKGQFSVCAEGFYQTEQNGAMINQMLADLKTIGISLFGTLDINEKFSLIGRYDYFDPVSNSDVTGDSRNLIIAGLSYRPDPKVAIIPNIMFESYEKLATGQEFDSSLTARITVYYEFL